jgi:hypothetical protein
MASRLRRSLLMVRAAPTGSLAMVKASTGVVELGEDSRGVGSVREGLRQRGDSGVEELGFGAQKTYN